VEAVRRGAMHSVGVDIQPLDWARGHVHQRHADVADRVSLVSTDGSLRELGEQRFEVVLSKDGFEHKDPEGFIFELERLLWSAPR